MTSSPLPVQPPVEPMLAKLAHELPQGDGWLFEPKWDGFRTLVFKNGDDVYLQSRDNKPLSRYFPEVEKAMREQLPERCVLDGEIVLALNGRLEFDVLQQRLHPAASRVRKLSEETPCSFVAWDVLALGDENFSEMKQVERRERLVSLFENIHAPIHITPATRDVAVATDWFKRFEGAGLDGVMAKPLDGVYQPGKRVMVKVKHQRTADCVVAGFRWFKNSGNSMVGSLVLGLYNAQGELVPVGVAGAFSRAKRAELVPFLTPFRENAKEGHPWAAWMEAPELGGSGNRWNADKDMSLELLRLELVAEVSYDHMQGTRFRHVAQFQRWRQDKPTKDCGFEQLEVTPPAELTALFAKG